MSRSKFGYTETPKFRCLEDLDQTHLQKSTVPLALAYAGREDCASGWSFGPYIREKYVIHVVTAGKGIYRVNGNEYELTEGMMFVIYPGVETYYQADKMTPWSYTWIGFTGYRADTVVSSMGFSKDRPVAALRDCKDICASIDMLLDTRKMTPGDILKRTGGLYFTLSLMIDNSLEAMPVRYYAQIKYVNMAAEIIAASYNKKIKIQEVADRVGINRSYLTNIFKREMNMSPQEFLINFRLEKAAEMLRESEEPVGSIASSVGYTDALTFSKAFKQKYGVTPTEFRNSVPDIEYSDKRGGYDGIISL